VSRLEALEEAVSSGRVQPLPDADGPAMQQPSPKVDATRAQVAGSVRGTHGKGDGLLTDGISPEQWAQILAQVKTRSAVIHALLKEVSLVAVDGETLRIRFEPSWAVHAAKVSEPRNREMVADAASEVLGTKVKCDVSAGEKPSAARQLPTGQRQAGGGAGIPFDDPDIQKAIEVFGAVDVRVITK
ncbi:MAG: hypothetical protein NUW23_10585, partial [Firmicutes bacterium]|nr:hypothetical protein [Bacillota bacterium]